MADSPFLLRTLTRGSIPVPAMNQHQLIASGVQRNLLSLRISDPSLEGGVERVVEKGRLLDRLLVVPCDKWEAVRDGAQTSGLGGEVDLVVEVGPVNDPGKGHQCGVVRTVLLDQRLERASTMRVLVRVGGARGIEARRTFGSLHLGDLLRFHEQQGSIGVDEPPDQPRGRRPVHLDPSLGHPRHRVLLGLQVPPVIVRRTRPITPAAMMTSGSGIRLTYTSTPSVPRAMSAVGKSMMARRPRTMAAPAMAPVAAAVTPSTNPFTAWLPAKRRK